MSWAGLPAIARPPRAQAVIREARRLRRVARPRDVDSEHGVVSFAIKAIQTHTGAACRRCMNPKKWM